MVTRYTVVQDGQVYEPGDDVPDMGRGIVKGNTP